mmetsp:Transcript_109124/g.307635  ORF Transcript_109124/g.307635 Transcript_109124/m.307635 type:complete len:774 (+) Transcript_109124:138-2459(+)
MSNDWTGYVSGLPCRGLAVFHGEPSAASAFVLNLRTELAKHPKGSCYFENIDVSNVPWLKVAELSTPSDGIKGIIDALIENGASTQRFKAFKCGLQDDTMLHLADYLAGLVPIRVPHEIHLSHNEMTSIGFQMIIQVLELKYLEVKPSVPLWLRIEGNVIDQACVQELVDAGRCCLANTTAMCNAKKCENFGAANTAPFFHMKFGIKQRKQPQVLMPPTPTPLRSILSKQYGCQFVCTQVIAAPAARLALPPIRPVVVLPPASTALALPPPLEAAPSASTAITPVLPTEVGIAVSTATAPIPAIGAVPLPPVPPPPMAVGITPAWTGPNGVNAPSLVLVEPAKAIAPLQEPSAEPPASMAIAFAPEAQTEAPEAIAPATVALANSPAKKAIAPSQEPSAEPPSLMAMAIAPEAQTETQEAIAPATVVLANSPAKKATRNSEGRAGQPRRAPLCRRSRSNYTRRLRQPLRRSPRQRYLDRKAYPRRNKNRQGSHDRSRRQTRHQGRSRSVRRSRSRSRSRRRSWSRKGRQSRSCNQRRNRRSRDRSRRRMLSWSRSRKCIPSRSRHRSRSWSRQRSPNRSRKRGRSWSRQRSPSRSRKHSPSRSRKRSPSQGRKRGPNRSRKRSLGRSRKRTRSRSRKRSPSRSRKSIRSKTPGMVPRRTRSRSRSMNSSQGAQKPSASGGRREVAAAPPRSNRSNSPCTGQDREQREEAEVRAILLGNRMKAIRKDNTSRGRIAQEVQRQKRRRLEDPARRLQRLEEQKEIQLRVLELFASIE